MKKINLLNKQLKYKQLEKVFFKLRQVVFLLFITLIIIFLSSFYILAQQKNNLNILLNEKQNLLEYILKNKETEAKFIYFNNRYKLINDILKNDVNFLPYYNLLTDNLKASSPEPKLDTMIIKKDKSVDFSLRFNDFSSLLSFLKLAESETFINNFNQLILDNFSVAKTSGNNAKSNYQLNFKGKFIQL